MGKVKEKGNQEALELLIWFIPAMILPMIAGDIGGEIPQIIMGGILGVLGGLIGSVFYVITKDKSNYIKAGFFGVMMISLIGTISYFINSSELGKVNFITCNICGYKSLEAKGKECEVCFVSISTEFMKEEGYESIKELIREEQEYFFESENDITYYTPKIYLSFYDEYLKDNKWKPVISKTESD